MVIYESLPIHSFIPFSQQSFRGKQDWVHPHFTEGESKSQGDWVTCSRPHMQLMVAEPEDRSSNSQSEGAG